MDNISTSYSVDTASILTVIIIAATPDGICSKVSSPVSLLIIIWERTLGGEAA